MNQSEFNRFDKLYFQPFGIDRFSEFKKHAPPEISLVKSLNLRMKGAKKGDHGLHCAPYIDKGRG